MKKISAANAKATRNFPDGKLTIGLDLGDRSSWLLRVEWGWGSAVGTEAEPDSEKP